MIYVPLPVDKTRREILRVCSTFACEALHCSRYDCSQLQFLKTPVHENLDLERLVKCTEGFSGAEVHKCVLGVGS